MPVPDIGPPPSPRPSANAEDADQHPETEDREVRDAEPIEQQPGPQSHHHDPHDDSGDVLVEGEEDMVIY